MRIGYDLSAYNLAQTGVRTVIEEIHRALREIEGEHEIVDLVPSCPLQHRRSALGKIWSHIERLIWSQWTMPRRARQLGCDVIYSPDYWTALWGHGPRIVDFYDASFLRNPEYSNRLWRKLFGLIAVPAARRAAAIITISQYARRELIRYYGFDPDKIYPIPLASKSAVQVKTMNEDSEELRAEWKIPLDAHVVLHVGVLERRKNLPMLVRAVADARPRLSKPVRLVLAGPPALQLTLDDSVNIHETVSKCDMEDSVILPGFINDKQLAAAYQIATIYAFPSNIEGFGIPILEAFHNGVPAVCSNAMSLPEVVGEAAILLDPDAQHDWTNALVDVLENPELQRKLAKKGKARAQQFTWEATAQRILSICREITN